MSDKRILANRQRHENELLRGDMNICKNQPRNIQLHDRKFFPMVFNLKSRFKGKN